MMKNSFFYSSDDCGTCCFNSSVFINFINFVCCLSVLLHIVSLTAEVLYYVYVFIIQKKCFQKINFSNLL